MAPIDPNPIAVIDSAAHARRPTPQTTTDSLEVAQQPGQSGAVAGSAIAATASTTTDKTAAIAGATTGASVQLPRITIRFCTQCRWMLRAAYVCACMLLCLFVYSFIHSLDGFCNIYLGRYDGLTMRYMRMRYLIEITT